MPPYLRTSLAAELGQLWNHQVTGAGSASYAVTQALDVALLAAHRRRGCVPDGGPAGALRPLFRLRRVRSGVPGRCAGTASSGSGGRRPARRVQRVPDGQPAESAARGGGRADRSAGRDGPAGGARLPGCRRCGSRWPACPPRTWRRIRRYSSSSSSRWWQWRCWPGWPRRGHAARAPALAARRASWSLLVNLWWMVPVRVGRSRRGQRVAVRRPDRRATWQWTQATLRPWPTCSPLNAHWGWDLPEYFRYAVRDERRRSGRCCVGCQRCSPGSGWSCC